MLRLMMNGLAGELHDVGILVQLWGEAVTVPDMSEMLSPIFQQVRAVMGPYLTHYATQRRGLSPDAAAAWAEDLILVFLGLGQGYIIQSALLPGFEADKYFRGVAALLDGEA
jgi:hypothetical protein